MEVLKGLLESSSLTELDQQLCSVMSQLGCENFSYNYYPPHFSKTGQTHHTLCTHSVRDWQAHYSDPHYAQIDPIFPPIPHTPFTFFFQI